MARSSFGDPAERGQREAQPSSPLEVPEVLDGTSAILIVDDDPLVAEVLRRMLTKEGYGCTLAANAAEARARLAESRFAVALVQLTMPGGHGLDLVPDVLPEHPDLAVIFVTGAEDPHLAELAARDGAHGFVMKPLRRSQVIFVVAAARQRRSAEISRRLEHEKELKDHEFALSKYEARWHTAFESAPVAIVELDLDGTITRANNAMEVLLEVSAGQLVGTNLIA